LNIKERVLGFKPRSTNNKLVGFAYTVKYAPFETPVKDFKNAGNYIDNVGEDEVIVIDNNGVDWCTTWGGILTQVALKRKINGVVVHGSIRDIDQIQYSQLPIFSQRVFMCSGKNRVQKIGEQCSILLNKVEVNPEDLVVGDGNGVIFIPKNYIIECLSRAINIENTEEKILEAVLEENMTLQVARRKYRYDQPWVEVK
jgi:regulator of RNase E activity RraA